MLQLLVESRDYRISIVALATVSACLLMAFSLDKNSFISLTE